MPHQNVDSSNAAARDAGGDPAGPVEIAGYLDEGDPIGADDVQQGSNHANRPARSEKLDQQGRKTRAGNLNRLKTGSADGRRA